jgi:protein farnesyltransferase subunit beta
MIAVQRRGIYCLLVTATLLNLLTPELIEGTAAFLASCQTYEGGFASSSQPYYDASPDSEEESARTLLGAPRPPLGEAHGGYAFCAIASLVIIRSYEGSTETTLSDINVKNLVRWLVQMQGSEAEIGGFKGRTNKLVDGCYSWWVGGAFSLLGVLGVALPHAPGIQEKDEGWHDVDGISIFPYAIEPS